MVQQSRLPHPSSKSFDNDHALSPTQTTRPPASNRPRPVPKRLIDHVVVLETAGRLLHVVQDLDLAIQRALADGPRGVVCDLSDVSEGTEPGAIEVLATAGRHVRDWPGVPVVVACPDQRLRQALSAHLLGRHLIVTATTLAAVSAVLATPIPLVARLRLAPHPTAPRASRDFVCRTLKGWGLGQFSPSACLVVSELVTNSAVHAGTDISVSVAAGAGAVRVTVRDDSPELPRKQNAGLGLHGRGLIIVAGFSRDFGVLPTAEGGKVVWAVLDANSETSREVATVKSQGRPPQPRGRPHSSTSTARENCLQRPTSDKKRCTDTEESSRVFRSHRQMAQMRLPDLGVDRGTQ